MLLTWNNATLFNIIIILFFFGEFVILCGKVYNCAHWIYDTLNDGYYISLPFAVVTHWVRCRRLVWNRDDLECLFTLAELTKQS